MIFYYFYGKLSWASQVALVVKNLPANAGDVRDVGSIPGLGRSGDVRDVGSIPGLGRSPGVGNSSLPQYSCLEKFHGQRKLAGYSPWGHKESERAEYLSTGSSIMTIKWHLSRYKTFYHNT